MVGLIAAFLPEVWLGLFSSDEEVIRVGTRYLQIAGPVYGFYGFGLALHSAMQGFGSVLLIVVANGVRLLASASGALFAIYWLDLGAAGFFVAVAIGSFAFAAMAGCIMLRVRDPAAAPLCDAELPFSVAVRPWWLPQPVSPPMGPQSPRCGHYR